MNGSARMDVRKLALKVESSATLECKELLGYSQTRPWLAGIKPCTRSAFFALHESANRLKYKYEINYNPIRYKKR